MSKQTAPKVTPELKQAVETYLLAKAYTQTIRPIVEAYQVEVLNAHPVRYNPEMWHRQDPADMPQFVKSVHDMYLGLDEDCAVVYAALDEAARAHGFTDLEPGYCPLLVAEEDERAAARLIVDAAEYVVGVKREKLTKFELYHKYVDTMISFVLASCPDISGPALMRKIAA